MKYTLTLLLAILLGAPALAREAPAAAASIQFDLQQDERAWVQAHSDANKGGQLQDFVLVGQSVKSWDEMVTRQVLFTRVPLRRFVDNWRRMLVRADRKNGYEETADASGAIVVEYRVPKAKEMGIRKFMQGPDGIYMLAYQVRPTSLDEGVYETWGRIIAAAVLVEDDEAR